LRHAVTANVVVNNVELTAGATGQITTQNAVPSTVNNVKLLGNAAIPVMILVLGMQLERASKPSRGPADMFKWKGLRRSDPRGSDYAELDAMMDRVAAHIAQPERQVVQRHS